MASSSADGGKKLDVVVAGGVGMGKSTCVGKLTGSEPRTGGGANAMDGVTKDIEAYAFKMTDPPVTVVMRDAPGIGDMDVKPKKLFQMYAEKLKDLNVGALLLFLDSSNPRFDLVAQMLVSLMDLCFPDNGKEKWKNFIVVLTKKDLLKDDLEGIRGDPPMGTVANQIAAFKDVIPKKIKAMVPDVQVEDITMCCVDVNDMSELIAALKAAAQRGGLGKYTQPNVSDMIVTMGKVMQYSEEEVIAALAPDDAERAALSDMLDFLKEQQIENDRRRQEEDEKRYAQDDAMRLQLEREREAQHHRDMVMMERMQEAARAGERRPRERPLGPPLPCTVM